MHAVAHHVDSELQVESSESLTKGSSHLIPFLADLNYDRSPMPGADESVG